MNLFSTKSSLPIPCIPANSFKRERISEELSFSLLIEIARPSAKEIDILSALSGAFSKDDVRCHISSGASTDGSSKISHSYEV